MNKASAMGEAGAGGPGGERGDGCPLLVPRPGEPGADRLPAYCRLPDGRVKVPSREELLALCRTAAYRDCAGYCRPRGW